MPSGATNFIGWPMARPVYSLPGGVYITLSPPLRQALEVVRKAAAGSPAQRRALLRAPRTAIRAAIGDETDETVLEKFGRRYARMVRACYRPGLVGAADPAVDHARRQRLVRRSGWTPRSARPRAKGTLDR